MPFLDEAEIRRRLQRHAAWHRHQLTDGPLVLLTSPDVWQNPLPDNARHVPPADPEALRAWWTDPQMVVRRVEEQIAARTFWGDALPFHDLNLGPGSLAAYMGCQSVFAPNTVWAEPLIADWATAPELALREDSFLWQACQAITRASASASEGRWLTGLTDIGGAMDITSYFRTPEKLCFDLLDHPAEVQRAEMAMLKAWFQVYDRLEPLVRARWDGTLCWAGLWYAGRTYMMQCDFSCMIGPEMFRRFVLPILLRQAAALDVASYHLDGPGAIRHLDDLLTIPNLKVVQWVPGSGSSNAVADWLDLYRRILKGGRAIQMYCRPDDLDLIFDQLDPDRIALWIFAGSDAEKTMAKIDRLRAKRKKPR